MKAEQENKAQNYKLWAMTPTDAHIVAASRHPFSRIVSDYILLYTDEDPPEGAALIGAENLHRLTGADFAWLSGCILALTPEWKAHVQTETAARMRKMVEDLETELEAQAQMEGEAAEDGKQHL